ncbi:hypothetical protein [Stratiformator vulcanicus]|uniref:Putative N6-adenine methyltransferase n=1 Tax=Stratiformator vulcanicus TaxID=2527980 RepID=A0A517R386_9PLAN|nr:hypothetical protein [Stratiformator vulcanicus]QDT38345.1 putative N6-adenine methyltransferase [Stratiformator vulcanicus]
MNERQENEQYFFDAATLDRLGAFVASFPNPCCVCCPLLGKWLVEHGHDVTTLDVDDLFSELPGFRHFDLNRPDWQGDDFGIIICDPPFYNVSLRQLFAALRLLSRNNFGQPLMISYLKRRDQAILNSLAEFTLSPSGFRPGYQTVQKIKRNEIEFFSNLDSESLAPLQS